MQKRSPEVIVNPKSPISDADRTLFRDSVGEVKLLHDDTVLSQQKVPPIPRQRLADERAVRAELGSVSSTEFIRAGVQPRLLRRLKRGELAPQKVLDLHGMKLDEAEIALSRLLQSTKTSGLRCIKIIHGKGLGSGPEGAVLKPFVAAWLRQRRDILAVVEAAHNQGGSGASVVWLRKLESPRQ